ncbi:MAG: phage tail protein [Chloroflexi bacterium]|nr:phage tail protein [Chloroflexota bacterium]
MGEPGLSLRFAVTIDHSTNLGTWTKCEGLAIDYEVMEYSEGGNNAYVHRLPGRRKYANIKLSRPVSSDTAAVMAWLASVQAAVAPVTARISVCDTNGETVATWNLSGVFPARWSGPTLDVGTNQAAIETLELAHTGFLGGPA